MLTDLGPPFTIDVAIDLFSYVPAAILNTLVPIETLMFFLPVQ